MTFFKSRQNFLDFDGNVAVRKHTDTRHNMKVLCVADGLERAQQHASGVRRQARADSLDVQQLRNPLSKS